MLREISIRNFAIIEQLTVALGPGFNVLTGETGAGKSILIDAVGALLGGRVGAEVVRAGSPSARVEGVFQLPTDTSPELTQTLSEYGVEPEEGDLILARDIAAAGRTTARVNGRAVPVSVLQAIGGHVVDLHGQSQHLTLLRPGVHLDILDEFAGVQAERAAFATGVARLRATRREIETLLQDEREIARRVDLLQFQIGEIDAAALQPGEDDALASERTRLTNAEKLSAAANLAHTLLYEGGDEQSAALDLIGRGLDALTDLARLDPTADTTRAALEAAQYALEDVAASVRTYRDGIEHNPERLAEVEERLETIRSLKRKYGPTIEEILDFGARAAADLDAIQHGEARLEALREREQQQLARLGGAAAALSARRSAAAAGLATDITRELDDLNMKRARFEVLLSRAAAVDGLPVDGETLQFDATGIDRVEFQVSPNPGEPLKPLGRIASGGELARVMLAIKGILSRADRTPTLIFDEVDTGIGGRTGTIVGEKLWQLARHHQVLCVTHLPQVAAFGDRHFRVGKEVTGERTSTRVVDLPPADRADELAQMLAGEAAAGRTQGAAREMLEAAAAWKAGQTPLAAARGKGSAA